MFYYKDELHPLLSSHPDIQKAWKAWDDIIFLWDKISKGDPPQNAENLHGTGEEASLNKDSCKSAVNQVQEGDDHLLELDSESVKNFAEAESGKVQEMDCRQNPGDDDLK